MIPPLSSKQETFFYTPLRRLNFLEGAVRSGKTFVGIFKFLIEVLTRPRTNEYLLVAKTLTSLERNILNPIQKLDPSFFYSLSQKKAMFHGRLFWLEGANDERAEDKIQGMTLDGVLGDEVPLWPRSFFTQCLARLSRPGAFFIGTLNPENPFHWLKKDFLDKTDLDMQRILFLLEDNPFLPPEYVENLKKEYGAGSVLYRRFILGQWCNAEGLIFEQFANNSDLYIVNDVPQLPMLCFGLDWGGNESKTVFVCSGFTSGYEKVYIIKDRKLNAPTGTIDPAFVNKEFERFVRETMAEYPGALILGVACDSAEQMLINGLRNFLRYCEGLTNIKVGNCDKDTIKNRIFTKNSLLNQGRYFIKRTCRHVILSTQTQMWDDKKQEDVRLDDGTTDIDTADAEEYSWSKFIKHLMRNSYGG